jgi:hypothetical protein
MASTIFTSEKSFAAPWVGNRALNALGLHLARIAMSDVCLDVRRRQLGRTEVPESFRVLDRDGVAVVPDFLGDAHFADVRREVQNALEDPPGIVRREGSTLNRQIEIAGDMTATRRFTTHPELVRLIQLAAGFRQVSRFVRIHELAFGDDAIRPDDQKILHKDTFHSTIKFWFFLDDCTLEHGPFCYVVGSHRMTRARYLWEYRRARRAIAEGKASGSFRLSDGELRDMGLPQPRSFAVAKNTLLVADTRGFHCRGEGRPGARRLSLYAKMPRYPFSPIP